MATARKKTAAPPAPAGYELVPIPIHEDAANAALDELKGAPAGFVRAVRLLLTRQHAVFVVQAEGGDEHAIHRARGVVAALYSFDLAVERGHDALDGRIAREYADLNLSGPPVIERASSTREALSRAESGGQWDLVITLYNVGEVDVFDFAAHMKACQPETPIVLLTACIDGRTGKALVKL